MSFRSAQPGQSTKAVFPKLVAELSEADLEELRRSDLHASGARERHLDVALLDTRQRGLEIEPLCREIDSDISRGGGLPQVGWQRVDIDDAAAPQNHRTLNDVLHLTDIAGPLVLLEQRHRLRRDAANAFPLRGADLFDEMRHENRNVLTPFAQGRELNRDDVQAIEEILS